MVLKPQFDTESEVPIYRQLYMWFRDVIGAGVLRDGERLPPTRELAGQLGLNRTTIAAAYELLESEGLIEGQVGRGSFVRAPSTGDEELISFATSRPAGDLFPLDEFRASCQEVISGSNALAILQLGSPAGYAPLRRYLMEQARAEGVARAGDDIIITSGCQQALDLIQRLLVEPGDRVVVEDPVYPGVKAAFSRAHLIGVPMGPDGCDIELLARVLAVERPRLLVLTPNFQNPTGASIPSAGRHEILQAAARAGVLVVENDTYGELRYRGQPLPAIKQLDSSGVTVLLRSFSKIAFPGLRVGWAIAPAALAARLAEAKQSCDLHTDQLSQAVLLCFAQSGRLRAHRERIVAAGGERLAATLAACERFLPSGSSYTRPEGGMNLWVRLPAPLDASELLSAAQRERVSYLPGRYFEVSRRDAGALRLSFAGLAPSRIRSGVETLGEVFSRELARARPPVAWEPEPAVV